MPRRNYPKSRPKRTSQPSPALLVSSQTTCRTKRRFPTERQAKDEIDTRELLQPTLTLSTYHCQWCDGWHLTSR